MKILGIETSCDEIAASVVEDIHTIRSNIIASSVEEAQVTGGVVPEVAARVAEQEINTVLQKALQEADVSMEEIDAIAVTNGPGLLGSLLVGIEAAQTLSFLHKKPLIPVFHIFGHMCANLLETETLPQFPVMVLTVSGGHNDMLFWKDPSRIEKKGHTMDDAAGECFDKCARMIDLPYPGGPVLSRLAQKGSPNAYHLPCPMIHDERPLFSFSGLKTAFFYLIRDLGGKENLSQKQKEDLAASLEYAICKTLVQKFFAHVDRHDVHEVHLTGGVSANARLRSMFQEESEKRSCIVRIPKRNSFCTDNAAMIAAAGSVLFQYGKEKDVLKKTVTPYLSHAVPNCFQ